MTKKRKRPHYSPEVQEAAALRAAEVGIRQAALEIGAAPSTVFCWARKLGIALRPQYGGKRAVKAILALVERYDFSEASRRSGVSRVTLRKWAQEAGVISGFYKKKKG